MTAPPSCNATAGPAIDILFESPLWQAVPEAADVVRRAIVLAARSVPDGEWPMPAGAGAGEHRFARSASAPARTGLQDAELSVLLCDDDAIASLNARWRGRDGPTNVLSFPAPPQLPTGHPPAMRLSPSRVRPLPLGDVAIAYETVAREAAAQGITAADHLAHLAVHGFLHLLGYDHQVNREAERMERLESDILARLGIADPYAAAAGASGPATGGAAEAT